MADCKKCKLHKDHRKQEIATRLAEYIKEHKKLPAGKSDLYRKVRLLWGMPPSKLIETIDYLNIVSKKISGGMEL